MEGFTCSVKRFNVMQQQLIKCALLQISPSTLFFIEGMGQLGYAMCWGDGFVTDPYLIQKFGLTDPKPFFNTLKTKSYKNNVVISPHYYPPSISGQSSK